jgi:hypothetical protein
LPFYDDEGVRMGIWDLVRKIVFLEAADKSWHLLKNLRYPMLKFLFTLETVRESLSQSVGSYHK